MLSKTSYVKLDREGLPKETTKKDRDAIAVRYDEFGIIWCKKHNCKLVLCRERH